MGDSISSYYDDLEEERRKEWQKESEDIIIDNIGCGRLREEIQAFLKRLESTSQSRYVWREIDRLKEKLKLK